MKHQEMRGKKLLSVFAICALAVGLTGFASNKGLKEKTFDYVKDDRQELERFTEEVMNEAYAQTTFHNWDVSYWKDAGMIEFIVTKRGLGSESSYQGFYYSSGDDLLGFQAVETEFIQAGAGWEWQETDGDNKEYVEKIMDNWYWFEMAF